ncbi:MAG: TonB-dependent receptor [Bacteroidota bacterium]|nr:TonB-dependent receptor [Bacteroidota bacterium]
MKNIKYFVFLLALITATNAFAQQKKVTFSLKNQTVKAALEAVKTQTGMSYWFDTGDVNLQKKITVTLKSSTVEEALKAILKGQDVTYKITDNRIVIMKNSSQSKSKVKNTSLIENTDPGSIGGTVTDEQGVPLFGVTVRIKGSTKGTITDANGHFYLSKVKPDETLTFSFVGMKTIDQAIENQKEFNVMLHESTKLDDVVVIGYGTQKRVNLTGSVASVSDKQIKTSTNVSLADQLTGKLPGLSVQQQSSEPGDYSSIVSIRGWGTPLIIVDGVKRSDYAKIDPNEVESISVLKDASAAIYGVEASNGVILITTKKGNTGKPTVTYSNTYGWQQVTNFPTPMTAAQYTEALSWAQQNSGVALTYTPEQVAAYKSGKLKGTNFWDVVMNNTAPQNQQNLTVSGGNDKIKYFNSLGYMTQDGLYKSGDLNYSRFNVRSNVTAEVTKDFTAQMNLSGLIDNRNSPSIDAWQTFKGIWMQIPTYNVFANNNPAYLQNMADGLNPYASTHSSIVGYNDTYNKTFDGSLTLNYKIPFIKGLGAKFFYDYYFNNFFNKVFNKAYTLYDYDAVSQKYVASTMNNPSKMSESYWETTRTTMNVALNYERTFGKNHHVQALALYEKIDHNVNYLGGSRQFDLDVLDQLSAGNSVQSVYGNNDYDKTDNQAFVGRLNYDYASKYLAELSCRYDGSSLFPEGKQWGFFPGVSLGWRMSEETFMKEALPFVTNLKVRGSWGKMGDDEAAAYQYVQGYNYPSTGEYGYVFGGTTITGLNSRGMTNPNITWYTSTTSNIGFDANLWGQKLNFSADLFNRKRTGLLGTLLLTLPSTVGASLPQQNINSDLSRGIELSAGTVQRLGEFLIGVNGQFSYQKMEWLHYEQAAAGNSYLNWRNNLNNRNSNIIWGYQVLGHFKSQEEIDAAPIEDGHGNEYVLIGDLKYKDVNQDGVIDDLDEVPIAKGNSSDQTGPEITYGFNTTLSWKGFDVSALLQGSSNFFVDIQSTDQLANPFPWGRNGLSYFMNVWHRTDATDNNSAWVSGKYTPSRVSGTNPNNKTSLYYVKDASYLRLKNLEIGYTVDNQLLKKIGFQKLRVFANGFNLLTWSKIPYMDPEHPQKTWAYLYPITRNYNLGVNVTF